jgi:transaldolase|tara:strand:- start:1597 stop:2259 length:663 start_codon:yes stop_codon:yes gene_type:complete
MKIFLDSASSNELKFFKKWGIIDGVTTNQKIFLKEKGTDFKTRVIELCSLANDLPVSVESNGNTLDDLLNDARNFSKLAPNVVAKIPMTSDGLGLEAVSILSKENIKTNVTAMMNLIQLIIATKAGATYVSLFYNRSKDAGEDPSQIIKSYKKWTSENKYSTKLIVGSIRNISDVEDAAISGADITTITPEILKQLPFHKKTEETLKEFDDAWKEFLSNN